MVRMLREIAVVEAASVAAAAALRVEREAGHQDKRCFIVGLRAVCDRLRHAVIAGCDGVQIVQPEKAHRVPEYLRHGDTLAVELGLTEDGNGADLFIKGKITVDRLCRLIGRVPEQLLRKTAAAIDDLLFGQRAFLRLDLRAKLFFIHKMASKSCRSFCVGCAGRCKGIGPDCIYSTGF